MAARIGERHIVAPAAGELRIHLYAVPHIHHQQEGRPTFIGRKCPGIVLCLCVCAQHGFIEALGLGVRSIFLGFQHKRASPVEVDSSWRGRAIPVMKREWSLEHVVLLRRRVGTRDAQPLTQFDQETLGR